MTNPRKDLGTALENRVVDRARKCGLQANRQPGSGIYSEYPNDVVVDNLLGECKVRTRHPSYTEMQEWLENAEINAKRTGKAGAFLVYNTKGSRTPRVMMDLDLFFSLLATRNKVI
jgi:Holliday junction resolvase